MLARSDRIADEHVVIFQPSGRRGPVAHGNTLKEASTLLGADIEGICGENAICGKCKVRVEQGAIEKYGVASSQNHLTPMTQTEQKFISPDQTKEGYRLACQAHVIGDVVLFVPEESRLGKQIVRKAARRIPFSLKPAVVRYLVELQKPTLDDPIGDWERVQEALGAGYGLTGLAIDYPVLLRLQDVAREGDWKITVSIWMGKEVIRVEPGTTERAYGLAVDVGTTTIAGYLCDLTDGRLVTTASMMNPQVVYGEDVMSRVTYTMTNPRGLEQLNKAILDGLSGIVDEVALAAGIGCQDIVDVAIAGNTCMHHLMLNIDPRYIGRSPFPPALHHSLNVKARDIGIKIAPGAYIHVLPVEAGFVGADNVAVLIAEAPHRQDCLELVIDIGTNGELILGNRHKLISCSCATGPALEGAEIKFGMRAASGAIEKVVIDRDTKDVRFKVIENDSWNTELQPQQVRAKGICGSGILDVVAQLFLSGVIDRTGRFQKGHTTPRLRVNEDGEPEFVIAWANETSFGRDVTVCQSDVRAIQLAKAAMYAGAKIMMRRLGVEKLEKVILAGAFGSFIDKVSAAVLGLFPDCALENIYAVGNAAGDGARLALLNLDKRREADEVARQVEYVELTVETDFDKLFAQAMWIPHMKDSFPHLENLLG